MFSTIFSGCQDEDSPACCVPPQGNVRAKKRVPNGRAQARAQPKEDYKIPRSPSPEERPPSPPASSSPGAQSDVYTLEECKEAVKLANGKYVQALMGAGEEGMQQWMELRATCADPSDLDPATPEAVVYIARADAVLR
jgi:hypothetical protein